MVRTQDVQNDQNHDLIYDGNIILGKMQEQTDTKNHYTEIHGLKCIIFRDDLIVLQMMMNYEAVGNMIHFRIPKE